MKDSVGKGSLLLDKGASGSSRYKLESPAQNTTRTLFTEKVFHPKNEPKKEAKYLVVKLADLEEYFDTLGIFLPPNKERERIILNNILRGIQDNCKAHGKKINSYIVVNEDEPYAETVWKLILDEEQRKINEKRK